MTKRVKIRKKRLNAIEFTDPKMIQVMYEAMQLQLTIAKERIAEQQEQIDFLLAAVDAERKLRKSGADRIQRDIDTMSENFTKLVGAIEEKGILKANYNDRR